MNNSSYINIGVGLLGSAAAAAYLGVSSPIGIAGLSAAGQGLAWLPDFVAICLCSFRAKNNEVRQLFSEFVDQDQPQPDLLRRLNQLPDKKIKALSRFIQEASRNPNMNSEEYFQIMCVLADVWVGESSDYQIRDLNDHPNRKEVVNLILPWIKNYKGSRSDFFNLINCLAYGPKEQRAEMFSIAEWGGRMWWSLLNHIRRNPSRVNLAKKYYGSEFYWRSKRFLDAVYALSGKEDLEQIEKGIERASFFSPRHSWTTSARDDIYLLSRIGALSENEWKNLVDQAAAWMNEPGPANFMLQLCPIRDVSEKEADDKLSQAVHSMSHLLNGDVAILSKQITNTPNDSKGVDVVLFLAAKRPSVDSFLSTVSFFEMIQDAIKDGFDLSKKEDQLAALCIFSKKRIEIKPYQELEEEIPEKWDHAVFQRSLEEADPPIIIAAARLLIDRDDLGEYPLLLKTLETVSSNRQGRITIPILQYEFAKRQKKALDKWQIPNLKCPPIFKEVPYTDLEEFQRIQEANYKQFTTILDQLRSCPKEASSWVFEHNFVHALLQILSPEAFKAAMQSVVHLATNKNAQAIVDKEFEKRGCAAYKQLTNVQLALLQDEIQSDLIALLRDVKGQINQIAKGAILGREQLELEKLRKKMEEIRFQYKDAFEEENLKREKIRLQEQEEFEREKTGLQQQIEALQKEEKEIKASNDPAMKRRIGALRQEIRQAGETMKKMELANNTRSHVPTEKQQELSRALEPLQKRVKEITANEIEPLQEMQTMIESYLTDLQQAIDEFRVIFQTIFPGNIEAGPLIEMLFALQQSTLESQKKLSLLRELSHGMNRNSLEPLKKYKARIKAYEKGNDNALSMRIMSLLLIFQFSQESRLMKETIPQIIDSISREKLQLPEPISAYQVNRAFQTKLFPNAFITYALVQLGDPIIMQALGDFAGSVCDGTFRKKRYDANNNPHLMALGQDKLEQWEKLALKREITLMPEEERHFDFNAWFTEKRSNGHLNIQEGLDIWGWSQKNGKPTESIDKALKNLTNAQTREEQIQFLQELQGALKDFPLFEFQNDLKTKLADLQRSTVKKPIKAVIEITDDPLELFLCGTWALESCQRVNGFAQYNRGLIGYVKNGFNKLVLIRDEQGNRLGRAMLKIPVGEKPCLHLEPFYKGVSCSSEYVSACKESIVSMGREASGILATDLVSQKENYPEQERGEYKQVLRFLTCSAPCEYSDTRRGVMSGAYEIGVGTDRYGKPLPPLVLLGSATDDMLS